MSPWSDTLSYTETSVYGQKCWTEGSFYVWTHQQVLVSSGIGWTEETQCEGPLKW